MSGIVISTPPLWTVSASYYVFVIAFEKNLMSSNLFTVCISSSILKISPLVGEECRDQFLLGIAEEFAEFAAEGFRVGSFESMFASDILLDSF